MSWDQVRTVTRFATPETDDDLAENAAAMSVTQLRKVAREVKLEDVQNIHHERFFSWTFDEKHPVVD